MRRCGQELPRRVGGASGPAVALAGTAFVALMPERAAAGTPMSYLESYGSPGNEIVGLTWGLLILAIVVVIIISVLVIIGVSVRPKLNHEGLGTRLPVVREHGAAMNWIYAGLALTTIVLAGAITWTMFTMAAIAAPPGGAKLKITVTGHQWWWEVTYSDGTPSRQFTTANEIHIPVGQPVNIELHSADVIHSFWVPALAGKTDLIPGQTNHAWLEADKPGVYRGQCTEYCGRQHAHMALRVFADRPEAFQSWWDGQLQDAPAPKNEIVAAGQQRFVARCGACHGVRGVQASARFGPDLSHLMSRTTLAAGLLPNNAGQLSAWIANPQTLKPDSKMPNLDISGQELAEIRQFLLTLK